ncbi:MAG: flavodoxin family protein [Desulfobacterales bacterium]|nr:flavodoxin family protein [Desulfobacterales bacterium]
MAETKKKKIIGLSCGRVNGNSEILLKEACMGAEELGVESEIIRAMELRVKPCKGCEACAMAMARGKEARCAIKDDDVPWILEKTLVEDCGLIVSAPVYHLRSNGYFEIIGERMLPTMFRHPEILKKTRVGAIISVGGGEPEWTPLGLTTINIFVQHTRILVDEMQVNFVGRPGAILMKEEDIQRARELGQNVARAMMMPIEEVKFVGDETDVACPVCHCNVLKVPEKLPDVYCPVCWVQGTIYYDGTKMKVKWNEENIKVPRFSPKFVGKHLDLVIELHKKFFTEDQDKVKELRKKYISYGKIIKP